MTALDRELVDYMQALESLTTPKRIASGRAWHLVRAHYAVVKRVSGHGMIDEIWRRRRYTDPQLPLRKVFADMARDLRAARRQP